MRNGGLTWAQQLFFPVLENNIGDYLGVKMSPFTLHLAYSIGGPEAMSKGPSILKLSKLHIYCMEVSKELIFVES